MSSKEYIKSSLISTEQLNAFAVDSGLIQRRSGKFSAEAFLLSLLGCVTSGMGSLNQMCARLASMCPESMVRQSLAGRFNQYSTSFLIKVLFHLIAKRNSTAIRRMEGMPFKRLLIEDSTFLKMGKGNEAAFPASGNQHGATSGVKVDFGFDLLTGNVIGHTINSANEPDQSIGKEFISHVREKDLVLRDMGYFAHSEFREIQRRGAFWLSRLPDGVKVVDYSGLPLEKLLAKARGRVVDTTVTVGTEKFTCRLVAVRADDTTVNFRLRKMHKMAEERQGGAKLGKRQIIRSKWHIMLTNLKWVDVKVGKLAEIYRARWSIEIQFRAWKQSFDMHKLLNRKSNIWHIEALLLASMIAHQIAFKLAGAIELKLARMKPGGEACMSYEKFYDFLAQLILTVQSIGGIFNFGVDLRHISRDKRARECLSQSILYTLA